jgi:hypothetical protein
MFYFARRSQIIVAKQLGQDAQGQVRMLGTWTASRGMLQKPVCGTESAIDELIAKMVMKGGADVVNYIFV